MNRSILSSRSLFYVLPVVVVCLVFLFQLVQSMNYQDRLSNDQVYQMTCWKINERFLTKALSSNVVEIKELQNLLNYELTRLAEETGKTREELKEMGDLHVALHAKVLDQNQLRLLTSLRSSASAAADCISSSSGQSNDFTIAQRMLA